MLFVNSFDLVRCDLSVSPVSPCLCAGNLEKSLGLLLVDFFRLFGRTLYTDDVGISCRDGGAFYSKIDAGLDQPGRPFMMSVEDPADPTNDLCRGSWNILKVRLNPKF